MFISIDKLESITDDSIIEKIKNGKETIQFYLSTIIEYNCSYLYWTIDSLKSKKLLFTNVKNENRHDFIKPNISDIVVKILSINDKDDWEIINFVLRIFSNTIGVSESQIFNNIYVFRIKEILSTLRKINFDISKLDLYTDTFSSVLYKDPNTNKKKVYSYIEPDVTVTLVLRSILKTFNMKARRNVKNPDIFKFVEIKDNSNLKDYSECSEMKELLVEVDNGLKIKIFLIPKIHLISSKLLSLLEKKYDVSFDFKLLYNSHRKVFLYFTILSCKKDNKIKFTLISGYPNLKLFRI